MEGVHRGVTKEVVRLLRQGAVPLMREALLRPVPIRTLPLAGAAAVAVTRVHREVAAVLRKEAAPPIPHPAGVPPLLPPDLIAEAVAAAVDEVVPVAVGVPEDKN